MLKLKISSLRQTLIPVCLTRFLVLSKNTNTTEKMHNVMARMIIPPKHPNIIIMVLFRNATDEDADRLGTEELFVKVLVLWWVINFDDGLHIKASEKERQ